MIRGMGADIVEVGKFRRAPFAKNKNFYQKIFTGMEIEYCLGKSDPSQHFAARFAAKEAILKCLRSSVYRISDVEISNDRDGSPRAKVKNQKGKFSISLSHTKDYAMAFALWQN